jgi:putative membrane-bound dehydrogenase-like protein
MRMRTSRWSLICLMVLSCGALAAVARSAPAAPAAGAGAGAKKRLLLVTQSKGYEHDVVKRKGGKPSVVERTFNQLAEKTGLFTVEATRDASMITPEKLKNVDIVVFYTTGVLPFKVQDLADWVKGGGRFMGLHSATDTFHDTPVYQKLIGGEFQEHPWTADTTVTIKTLDPDHPAAKPWGAGDTFKEEIYHQKNFDPAAEHVIIDLDMQKTALKKPYLVPIAWCKQYGKGKVFYTSLGHREDMWTNPKYQAHLVGAIKWLTGQEAGDAKPNPDVSRREEEIAKKAAGEAAPKGDAKTQAMAKPEREKGLPSVPDGFAIHTFVRAPQIKSPASIAVAPDGKLFVGEDEYNTQPKREQGLARVKLCVDTDHDGKADRITVFADGLNAPQGMTFVNGTLYVVHAPRLTALRDTDGDGVADRREDLVTGLGPVPEGLVHHVPSGVRMGIDGWLYISVGDKGIEQATGRDGRTISLWGGGTVRVRPDGTMLEVFSHHTRNTFDVALSPLLDTFTRDNTNDGDGWDSRLAQMIRDGEYGYPSLFKHWGDEIVQPVASYGSGSATGSLYLAEPGYPKAYGDSLYACDWARGVVYRHEMKRQGAGFTATQEEFVKGLTPTDLDADGQGELFVADWGRRDWGNAGPVGRVFVVEPVHLDPATRPAAFPDIAKASEEQLLGYLTSPSHITRLSASQELLRRGPSGKVSAALTTLALEKDVALPARVAAVFTLKQLDGEAAGGALATMAAVPELRE